MGDEARPPALQRVLLKLSGEALAGEAPFGVQPDAVMQIDPSIVCAWPPAASDTRPAASPMPRT